MSPEPVYRSVFGYGHSGRLRVVFDRPVYGPIVAGKRLPVATISSGATPRFIKLPPSLLQRAGTFELALHVAGFARPSVSSALDPSFWNWVTRSMHTVSLVFRLPPQCQLVMSFGSAPLPL